MARRAITNFDQDCQPQESTVCFWLVLAITVLPIIGSVGPPYVRAATKSALVALRIVYAYFCESPLKAVGSPLAQKLDLDDLVLEGTRDLSLRQIIENIKGI